MGIPDSAATLPVITAFCARAVDPMVNIRPSTAKAAVRIRLVILVVVVISTPQLRKGELHVRLERKPRRNALRRRDKPSLTGIQFPSIRKCVTNVTKPCLDGPERTAGVLTP